MTSPPRGCASEGWSGIQLGGCWDFPSLSDSEREILGRFPGLGGAGKGHIRGALPRGREEWAGPGQRLLPAGTPEPVLAARWSSR